MGRRNELPPEKQDEVAERYLNGDSIPRLQLDMHRSAWMISRILDERNISRRPPGRKPMVLPSLPVSDGQDGEVDARPAAVARMYGVRRELARRMLNPNITRGGRPIKSV